MKNEKNYMTFALVACQAVLGRQLGRTSGEGSCWALGFMAVKMRLTKNSRNKKAGAGQSKLCLTKSWTAIKGAPVDGLLHIVPVAQNVTLQSSL